LENADLVSGCSDFLGKEAKKLYKNPIDIHTIYTGIDIHKFKPLDDAPSKNRLRKQYNIAENDLVVLNVGSAIQRKGWLELFESVAKLKLKYPNIKILAASGGLQDFKLSDKAKEFGVADHLIDLGQVKNENLLALYQLCDIFVLPSYWEGLANVLCEAMSCGCAVVTSAVAGHPEVVQSGVNGLLIEPKSVDSLTSALDQMMASADLRKSFGSEARKTAETKIMSHEENAQRLMKLFEAIV
jgi:teichuronic acid biosynthesis glycosyltransferase TuaC